MTTDTASLLAHAARVRLLLADVDGVMTDGRILFFDDGGEAKAFNVRDGLGLVLAREAGLVTGIVSGRPSRAAERRARELKMAEIHLAVRDKLEIVREILERRGLDAEMVCFVGDDRNDLPVLSAVGFPAAPADAAPEVQRAAAFVTRARGGHGALREVVDLILRARGEAPDPPGGGRVECAS